MSEHTPGPWLCTPQGTVYALDETGNCNRFSARVEGGWKWRGHAMTPSQQDRTPADELDANARLIAAAPELLAACIAFMPKGIAISNGNVPDDLVIPVDVTMGEFRQLAAAIAKATQTPTSED